MNYGDLGGWMLVFEGEWVIKESRLNTNSYKVTNSTTYKIIQQHVTIKVCLQFTELCLFPLGAVTSLKIHILNLQVLYALIIRLKVHFLLKCFWPNYLLSSWSLHLIHLAICFLFTLSWLIPVYTWVSSHASLIQQILVNSAVYKNPALMLWHVFGTSFESTNVKMKPRIRQWPLS